MDRMSEERGKEIVDKMMELEGMNRPILVFYIVRDEDGTRHFSVYSDIGIRREEQGVETLMGAIKQWCEEVNITDQLIEVLQLKK